LQIYLPIAELPVNVFLIVAMGIAVGFVSGMFGIGGGFLMTPMLIFAGIPAAVAVATVSSHMAASSLSGAMTYWRRRQIDVGLGLMLLAGGIVGTSLGVVVFAILRAFGQLELAISLSYVVLLVSVGVLMVRESIRTLRKSAPVEALAVRRAETPPWFAGLPLRVHFKQSRIVVSAIPVVLIGFGIGFLGSVMGIGGGFLLVPALIYLLRVPTNVVIGTSLFLTLLTMVATIVLHAVTNKSVDVVLALMLMAGGVLGAQFGAKAGIAVKSEVLRLMLGLLVLTVGLRFLFDLVVVPRDLWSVTMMEAGW
jgi:uncharacterized membrane protein YfcA